MAKTYGLNKTQFSKAVLTRLGVTPSSGAVKALNAWQQAEGGHTNGALFNPLNTTEPEPGAGNTGTQGNIKVYKNLAQGINATVATLKNGKYTNIIHALRTNNPDLVADAIGTSPWGTSGDLVRKVLGSPVATNAQVKGTSPKVVVSSVTPASTTMDSKQAIIDTLLHPHGSDLSSQLIARLESGAYTTTTPASTTPAGPSDSGTKVSAIMARANTINKAKLPYLWGGGHAAKVDVNSKLTPLDCSGTVSAVLGINPRVAKQFETFGKPGDGGSRGVTIYAKNTHVIMKINGHFFGTSASNPGGGAGWIPQSAISKSYLAGFTARHE